MASKNKMAKTDKRKHWGRGGNFLKGKGKGVKGLSFYTSAQRKENKKCVE